MKYKKYILQKGDTLEKIALELGMPPAELRAFHNRYCELSDLIGGSKIPSGLQYLLIPEVSIKETINFQFGYNDNEDYYYEINTISFCKNLGKQMYKTQTDHLWKLKLLEKKETNYIVELTELTKKVTCSTSLLDNYLKLNALFDEPTKKLKLKLNKFGQIVSILNQEEIYNKWNVIKEEINKLSKEPNINTIIESGEQSFTNTLSLLQTNLLYTIFFPKIYTEKNKYRMITEVESKKMPSLIFSGQELEVIIKEKLKSIEDRTLQLEQKSFLPKYSKTVFYEKYKKEFSQILGNIFDYKYEYSSDYIYKEKGILCECNSIFEEKANENMIFHTRYIIKRKNI